MAIKTNLVIDQGSDFIFTFDIEDDNDQAIDLTGYTGAAEMRKHFTSTSGHSFSVAIVPLLGEVTLSMNAASTSLSTSGRYMYDCELTDSLGKVSRVIEGIVTVTPRVGKD